MPKLIHKIILLFLIVSNAVTLEAAHLIGGDLSYTCLGNNVYSVKLRMYRDCAGGGANFDQVTQVAIYDVNDSLIANLNLNIGPITPVSSSFQNDPCITVPPNLCVEFTEYEDTLTLPPVDGGYLLVHQRCCRNANISNVTNSGSIGNTYSINIPSQDTTCNSSIQFNGDIELVSCVGFPINLPLNYTEADGDSVSFQLCQIFEGGGPSGGAGGTGNCNAVIPSPPCPPPYQAVSFQAPATATSPIPSNPAFTVDSVSGLLTGTPTVAGNYVLGICATEWRNGRQLSTTRLDYQLAVTTCVKSVVSDMVTQAENPQINCNGLTLDFESESINANSVKWIFGDTTTLADTAVNVLSSYTFPAPGNYTVTLIANPGLSCSDTTTSVFRLYPLVNPDFSYDGVLCFEANLVDFFLRGNYAANSRYTWDFGPNAEPTTSSDANPEDIVFTNPGQQVINLKAEFGDCERTFSDTINILPFTLPIKASSDTTVNRGDAATLSANSGYNYYWYAGQAVEFSDRYSQRISVELMENQDSVMFYVIGTNAQGCEGIDSVLVKVNPTDFEPPDNFISPNGDGFNEFLDLSNINPRGSCAFSVLNRWGSVIYETSAYANDWAGVNQSGTEVPDGTYYWVLKCGFTVSGTGAVTVVRSQ
jgi:gliding motility-associated-like protein